MNEQKMKAIEKINKLLAKARDKATPAPEADTCMAMANKIAAKNGLKIVKNTDPAPIGKKYFSFHLNCFDKKFVGLFFSCLNIRGTYTNGGDIQFEAREDFNVEAFKAVYKKFVSVYYGGLKKAKACDSQWNKANTSFYKFCFFKEFKDGFCGMRSSVYHQAWDIGAELKVRCGKGV